VWLKNGSAYAFEYHYDGRNYIAELTDFRDADDSLAFFKISRIHQELWEFLEFTYVPKCISTDNLPEFGFEKIPTCKNQELLK